MLIGPRFTRQPVDKCLQREGFGKRVEAINDKKNAAQVIGSIEKSCRVYVDVLEVTASGCVPSTSSLIDGERAT